MNAAPIPADEPERLKALHQLLILDTPPEERFDRIVQFAASEFDMPIVLISLVDIHRQWFKARVGMDACETARDVSFCSHVVHAGQAMVVEDALLDPRFADNPLVLGAPHIRFYAGMPLQMPGGEVLGTLCLIDHHPRQLDAVDLSILGQLRALVMQEIQGQGLENEVSLGLSGGAAK